ncbi:MAG: 1-acyl-sn-glycerol-3-phosphate acyltransferase [Myxococcota bacterium]|nr:1-acyl-sn-glycerol-3-phosphate acyltransferase [Myxococcota bacterium]
MKPGTLHPLVVWVFRWLLGPLLQLAFRPRLRGLEKLPQGKPYLLVANHSAGVAIAEILCFAMLYAGHFKNQVPLAGYAHHVVMKVWPFSWIMPALGAIPSTYEAAENTLAAGIPILMFPGGEHESLRPIWKANEVDFNGRLGYLRIARKRGIPIVPMGITGSHYTAPIFWRSKLLATLLLIPKRLGFKRWCISLSGILGIVGILQLDWPLWAHLVGSYVWLLSIFQFTPIIPATLRFEIGEILEWGQELDGENLEETGLRVQAAVQARVNEMNRPNERL